MAKAKAQKAAPSKAGKPARYNGTRAWTEAYGTHGHLRKPEVRAYPGSVSASTLSRRLLEKVEIRTYPASASASVSLNKPKVRAYLARHMKAIFERAAEQFAARMRAVHERQPQVLKECITNG